MAYPVYEDNGGIWDDGGSSVTVPWPLILVENDIVIVIVGDADDDDFATPVSETWAKVAEHTAESNFSAAWFWHRVTAAEESVPPDITTFVSSSDAGQVVAGVMLRFSGCYTGGDPFESATLAGVTKSGNATVSEITTLNTERLCCCLIGIEDNVGTGAGTNYVKTMEVTTSAGSDMGFSLFTYQKSTAGVVSAETVQVAGDDYWATYTFALRATAPAVLPGYANDVIGVGTADIGEVNTVATADIAEVIGV
jgi:hypothetical protein